MKEQDIQEALSNLCAFQSLFKSYTDFYVVKQRFPQYLWPSYSSSR